MVDLLVVALIICASLLGLARGSSAAPTPWYYPDDTPELSSDADRDGVPDSQDRCVYAPGSAACFGCPSDVCDTPWRVERESWFTTQCAAVYGVPTGTGSFSQFIHVGDLPCDGLARAGVARVSVSGTLGSSADGNYLEAWLVLPDGTPLRAFPRVEGSCGDFSVSLDISDDEFRQFCSWSYIRVIGNYLMTGDCINCSLWGGTRGWRVGVALDLLGPDPHADPEFDGYSNKWDPCPLVAGDPNCGDGCPRNACGLCGSVGVQVDRGNRGDACLDADGDGVPDWRDRCPMVSGSEACGGCPSDVCGPVTSLELLDWVDAATAVSPYGCPADPTSFERATVNSFLGRVVPLPMSDVTVTLSTNVAVRGGEWVAARLEDSQGTVLLSLPAVQAHPMCEEASSAKVISAGEFSRLYREPYHITVLRGVSSWDSATCWGSCLPSASVKFRFDAPSLPAAGSDLDHDGIPIEQDNCPHLANADQRDCDGDGIGDRCAIIWGAPDLDGGGVPDRCQFAYGDLDLNGTVDFADIALLLMLFGEVQPEFGDLDGDQTVSMADLAMALLNFGPMP